MSLPTPFYDQDGCTIYCGDARRLLPLIKEDIDVTIWDPVWPNFHPELAGSEDPQGLFSEICQVLPDSRSLHIWLGVQSDPRFLSPLTKGWTFLRTSYLSRAVPGYNGRCLVTGDLLYSFGEWPKSKEGAHVIPGECRVTSIFDEGFSIKGGELRDLLRVELNKPPPVRLPTPDDWTDGT